MAKTTTISITDGLLAGLLLLLAVGVAAAADNPHWNKATCATCHSSAKPAPGNAALRTPTAEAGCESCHDGSDAVACRHASGIPVGSLPVGDMYQGSLRDGRVVCTTCHDPVFQCEHPNVAYRFQNPGFLRGRVSRNTGDQCFTCHGAGGYAKLNPHTETTGDPPRKTCLLCHAAIPGDTGAAAAPPTFNMRDDLNDMCRGCHVVAPHPKGMGFGKQAEGWVHLVRPSGDVTARMEASEAATQVTLPLSPYNGEIYCATCHDPHAYRAPGSTPDAQSSEHLLRQDKICQACHDK